MKFTPEDGGITVESHMLDGQFHCIVADTGLGIPETALNAIFISSISSDGQRAGCAKAPAWVWQLRRTLVEMYGGHIAVTSKPGKGSRFEFVLPVEGPGPPKHVAEDSGAIKRILIVSPDSEHSDRMAGFLRGDAFEVWRAASLREAEQLTQRDPNAAIIDLAAFGSDGWTIVQGCAGTAL